MARAFSGLFFLMAAGGLLAEAGPSEDLFPSPPPELKLTFFGHATFMITWGSTVVHVDPVGQYADYAALPKADVVLVTHEHFDHLDAEAIRAVSGPGNSGPAFRLLPAQGARRDGRAKRRGEDGEGNQDRGGAGV